MRGHIKLGAVNALRDYMLMDYRQYLESTANQMAAQIGGGAGDYNDLQSWAAWVMDDWRAGVGKKDAEAGGFLFATAETRYPNQARLPRHLALEMSDAGFVADCDAAIVSSEITIGTGQTYQKWAMQLTGGAGQSVTAIWVYLKNNGQTFTVRLSGNTAGAPGTSIATCTVTTTTTRPGYSWYKTSTISQAITSAAYWLSLEVASTGTLPLLSDTVGGPSAAYWDGAAWQTTTDIFGVLLNPLAYDDAVPADNTQVVEFNGELYAIGANAPNIYKRDTGTAPGWTSAAGSVTATQAFALGDYLYLAKDSATDTPSNMDTSETITSFVVPGTGGEVAYFAMWGGLLWSAYGNHVWYTDTPAADGAQWTGPIEVAHAGVTITGIAGLGDYLYVATSDDLAYIGYGDEVRGVTVWGSPSPDMGKGMLHYQGSLFIPNQEALLRWDGSNMLPMGVDLGEGLPDDYQGNVAALTANNNWLLMGIDPRNSSSSATLWAYNGQGWHHIATLPPTINISSLYYRRTDQRLYIGCDTGHVFSLYLPDVAGVVDTTEPEYAPVGWLETDWWFGGLREVAKDIESIYILGETMSANQTIKVYWQDDDSAGWELLGTATADRQEIRWSDYSTRPNTRALKLGFLLQTTTPSSTPVLRAVRLKYHAMVTDWSRWRIPVQVSDDQMMLDDDINIYTATQQRAHIKALTKQVQPVIFEDMDGTQYEVKIVDASFQLDKYEYIEGNPYISGVYHVTAEQVTQDEYGA